MTGSILTEPREGINDAGHLAPDEIDECHGPFTVSRFLRMVESGAPGGVMHLQERSTGLEAVNSLGEAVRGW